MTVTEELENRCKALSTPIIERMARHIIRGMNINLSDQVQSDFARIGMSFFDQMSLLHRERDYADFFFGFEDELDRMIEIAINSLNEVEKLVLDFKNASVTNLADRKNTLFRDVKLAFGTLLEGWKFRCIVTPSVPFQSDPLVPSKVTPWS